MRIPWKRKNAEELDQVPATSQPAPVTAPSGQLWTDREDASTELNRRVTAGRVTDVEAGLIRDWIAKGYVILEGAIPAGTCDAFSEELARMWREGASDVLMQVPGQHGGGPIAPGTSPVQNRVVDIYAVRSAALDLLFAKPIVRFLGLVFDKDPLLFQSLTFECGSEQAIHQDTAYVVVHPPLSLAAAWIALQDVQEGSGELQYYEGSHRLPTQLFSGEYKHWNRDRDGDEAHGKWLESLHVKSRELALPLRTFRPKQGDVLIWSADLAHGGAPVQDRSLTRRSLVGHYCPVGSSPNYFTYRSDRQTTGVFPGGQYSSEYYDLGSLFSADN
jgi:phytanoyl-CoA hydroxylase